MISPTPASSIAAGGMRNAADRQPAQPREPSVQSGPPSEATAGRALQSSRAERIRVVYPLIIAAGNGTRMNFSNTVHDPFPSAYMWDESQPSTSLSATKDG